MLPQCVGARGEAKVPADMLVRLGIGSCVGEACRGTAGTGTEPTIDARLVHLWSSWSGPRTKSHPQQKPTQTCGIATRVEYGQVSVCFGLEHIIDIPRQDRQSGRLRAMDRPQLHGGNDKGPDEVRLTYFLVIVSIHPWNQSYFGGRGVEGGFTANDTVTWMTAMSTGAVDALLVSFGPKHGGGRRL